MTKTEHRFRVRVQGYPLLDFSLRILVEPYQVFKLNDLVHRIYLHVKYEIKNLEDYDITIRQNSISYKIRDDVDLYYVLSTSENKTNIEVELYKKMQCVDHRSISLAEPIQYHRKDSGVSFDEELLKTQRSAESLRLPRLSTIIDSIPFCHQSFTKKSLPVLLQKPRASIAPFTCKHLDPATGKVCRQVFRRSYDLSRHQMIHLKDRPFFHCSDCDRKFTRLDALRRHERIQGHDGCNKK